MKLSDYKLVFTAVGLIGILLIASPTVVDIFQHSGGEQFSELYLLGPDQMAENIPFNVNVGKNYSVYVGVGNHFDSLSYYTCYVKLRNQTELLPNETAGTPSSLPPLYEYRMVVPNGANYTVPFTFSLSKVAFSNNQCLLESITINNLALDVDKIAQFDQENNGYYFQLFVELWAFNSSAQMLQYQNRYVYFWLNATSPP